MPEISEEISLSDIGRELLTHRRLLVVFAVVFGLISATVWSFTPVIVGVTYKASVYPDGAPLYSAQAIKNQLELALLNAGYKPAVSRGDIMTVRVTGGDDGTKIVGAVLSLTTSVHASVRSAAYQANQDCGELCVRLTSWADAHDADLFRLISLTSEPYRKDNRLLAAVLTFVVPMLLVCVALIMSASFRRREKLPEG